MQRENERKKKKKESNPSNSLECIEFKTEIVPQFATNAITVDRWMDGQMDELMTAHIVPYYTILYYTKILIKNYQEYKYFALVFLNICSQCTYKIFIASLTLSIWMLIYLACWICTMLVAVGKFLSLSLSQSISPSLSLSLFVPLFEYLCLLCRPSLYLLLNILNIL